MIYSVKTIEEKLQSYGTLKKRLLLLEYELEHPKRVTSTEVLNALAYGSLENGLFTTCTRNHTDRVFSLVGHYNETADIMNQEVLVQIHQERNQVCAELSRLDAYIDMLDGVQKKVIQARYIENKAWRIIEQETGLSRRTLIRRKQEGVQSLIQMYSYTNAVMKEKTRP